MDTPSLFPVTIVSVAVLAAAVTDVIGFRVYNVVTIPLIIGGIVFHAVTEQWGGLAFSLTGVLFAFCVLLIPYILGAMGAGDVKLIAGMGAWLGGSMTALVFLVATLAGLVYSIVLVSRQGSHWKSHLSIRLALHQIATLGKHLGTEEGVSVAVRDPTRRHRLIPFAAMTAIALFTVIACVHLLS